MSEGTTAGRRPRRYILEGRTPVPADDMPREDWDRWFGVPANRRVARTFVGDCEVSTVFLAYDHAFTEDDPPMLFETMVFGDEDDDHLARYSTWAEAEAGHRATVERVRAAADPGPGPPGEGPHPAPPESP